MDEHSANARTVKAALCCGFYPQVCVAVLSCLVLSCLVLSCLVLSCLVLSCLCFGSWALSNSLAPTPKLNFLREWNHAVMNGEGIPRSVWHELDVGVSRLAAALGACFDQSRVLSLLSAAATCGAPCRQLHQGAIPAKQIWSFNQFCSYFLPSQLLCVEHPAAKYTKVHGGTVEVDSEPHKTKFFDRERGERHRVAYYQEQQGLCLGPHQQRRLAALHRWTRPWRQNGCCCCCCCCLDCIRHACFTPLFLFRPRVPAPLLRQLLLR